MSQQGDIFLFQTIDDGNITVEGGVIEMSSGLDTAAYLSLFGGNEDCSARQTCPFTWWGNTNETDTVRHYKSETQHLLKGLPAITANLRRIEDAANRDLSWFLEQKIASSVTVNASIPALNQIQINITIVAEGVESSFEFVENWKDTKITQEITEGNIATDIVPITGISVAAQLSQQQFTSFDLNQTYSAPINKAIPELNTTRF